MRAFQIPVLLSAALLLAACGDNGSSQAPTPNTQAPIVKQAANPITEGVAKVNEEANKLAGEANAKLEAAKAEVAKYQKQVEDFVAEKGGLEAKITEAQKALDEIYAKAKAEVAPLQAQLDKVNEQIKSLESLKLGAAGRGGSAAFLMSLDLGGLAGQGSDKLAGLKAEAAKYQQQIDSILGKAKELGLPYTEQITALTSKLQSVTSSLTTAQGLLDTAKQNLASLSAPAQ